MVSQFLIMKINFSILLTSILLPYYVKCQNFKTPKSNTKSCITYLELNSRYSGRKIKGLVNIPVCERDTILINNSTFDEVNFDSCYRPEYFSFGDCKFLESFNISNAQLYGHVNFSHNTFDGDFFAESIKANSAEFEENTFSGGVTFNHCVINNSLNFKSCKFSGAFIIADLSLSDSARISFEQSILPDGVYLLNIKNLKNEINLSDAYFPPRIDSNGNQSRLKIGLYNIDLSKIRMDYQYFHLVFLDSIGNEIDNRSRLFTVEDRIAIYEGLLSNFKVHGQLESFKLLDIEYQEFKWNNSWAKGLSWLPRWWWNWGYDKEFVFYRTLQFLFGFTILTFFLLPYLNKNVYAMENIKSDILYKEVHKRLWYSFVYTSSIFFRLTLKIEKIKFDRIGGTIYILIVYTAGLFCLAYMANFVIQK